MNVLMQISFATLLSKQKALQGPRELMPMHGDVCVAHSKKYPMTCVMLLLSLARHMCTQFIHPEISAPLLACRLVALDKNPGVRPIGVCEVARRIISKAILFAIKGDIQEAAGSRQMCSGQIAGIEAAVHSVRHLLANDKVEAILLVDAINAFQQPEPDHCPSEYLH